MGGELVGRVHGSLPEQSQWIERNMTDEVHVGSTYEFHGHLARPLVWMFPDAWLENWVQYAYALAHPKFKVTGAQIDTDGAFRIQVVALGGSPLLIIGGALIGLMAILAGMSIERVFEAVGLEDSPKGPAGAAKDFGFVLVVGGLAAGAIWAFGRSSS
jgi:hypothetical protein